MYFYIRIICRKISWTSWVIGLQNIQISEKLIHTPALQDLVLNFDEHFRIFLSFLYLLTPAIIFSVNLIHISSYFWEIIISAQMK